jgi:ATP-binding cassette subfamily B protein RaxB
LNSSLKLISSNEAAECGLASIAMIANAYGHQCTLSDLRQRFTVSLKGATLDTLIQMSNSLGMQSRALRLELSEVGQLRLPCILHWDLSHFVVLAEVRRNGVVIFDPARGRRVLGSDELSKHFTGVALEAFPTASFEKKKLEPTVLWSGLIAGVRGLRRSLALLLGLSLALQIFTVIGPMLTQWTVDQVLVSADQPLLVVLVVAFSLSLLLQMGIGIVRSLTVINLSTGLGLQWAGNVLAHLLKLPIDYFEKRHLGDIVSRMGSIGAIQRTLTTSFVEALIDGLMASVTVVLMLIYSWKLAVITFAAVTLYLGLRLATYRAFRDRSEQQMNAAAKQQTHLLESIRGVSSLRLAGVEARRQATYGGLMVDTTNHDVRLAHMGLGFSTASGLIFGAERIAVIAVGAMLAMSNVFSVGMLIAYLAYKDQFAGRISALIDKLIEFRMLRLHGERLSDIVLTPPEADAGSAIQQVPRGFGLSTRGLSFRYADGEPWVLKDLDLEIAEGESVAIVGPSGCGKTTLVKLLLGVLRPVEGELRIGDQPLAQLGVVNFRRHVGAVMQDDQLFAGSLIDNIALGDETFDLTRIEAAARLAAVHDDIQRMPMGYHTLIGDMGAALSGGQKQRVILARALYRKPKVLVLDEATSHLDVERERLVNDAVKRLKLTRIIIAHRPETIASADRVLVMQQGRIVQQLAAVRGGQAATLASEASA